jgi:hypothetical protein
MKWVVLVIVVCLAAYTVLTLHFRKESPAFRPYEDMQNRANVARLLSAGYQRIPITAERPADPPRTLGGAVISPAPGGMPAELRSTLVTAPLLPVEILSVTAAFSASSQEGYPINFTCTQPNAKQQLAGADLYVRGDQLVLVPRFEYLSGDLALRSQTVAVLITVPAGALKPGRYTVMLVAERASKAWSLELQ